MTLGTIKSIIMKLGKYVKRFIRYNGLRSYEKINLDYRDYYHVLYWFIWLIKV